MSAIRLLAGPRARERIGRDGLRPESVAGVAAAAGGPKGLAFLAFDAWLFGDWLAEAPPRPRLLAGASIGAWRMAAAVHPDGPAATRRLGEAYLELQRYPVGPSSRLVSAVCRQVVEATVGDASRFVAGARPAHSLAVVTARGRGAVSHGGGRLAFARPAVANLMSRRRLGAHLQRVVFGTGEARAAGIWPDDAFSTRHVALDAGNAVDALLASGTIPLLADPVRDPGGAPAGAYWDGGLVDYHLFLEWRALDGLLLYPHFTPWLTPGWLDKSLPWRRRGPARHAHWLDDTLLVVPSDALLARLPGGRLPERQDFHRHGADHDGRLRDWRRAMAECAAMAEDFAAFVRRPDPARLEPIGAA
ncbi:MAG: patatin-like phospholipase family protein [Burkholderiales bacterium]|nr:MAG: patatin-like phospholipase family protein [Burkholderiales bacterium]